MSIDEWSDLQEEIERRYRSSGNRLGWRLLYSPSKVLRKAEVAFIGVNPGGSVDEPDHGEFAMASGSAYCCESWDGKPPGHSRLQQQAQALFHRLEVLREDVLAGNLVPFRSPDWKSINNRRDSLEFGMYIWKNIFHAAKPSIVVSMGGVAHRSLCRILGVDKKSTYKVGWGEINAERGEYAGGTWIGLPHLSRFPIMGRKASEEAVDRLFDGLGRAGSHP